MNVRYAKQLVACFFTGIVPEIPTEIIQKRGDNWRELSLERKKDLIKKIEERSKARRASMSENATRNNYIFAGLAFITAASTNVMLAKASLPITKIMLQTGVAIILIAVSILLLNTSAKRKVWQKTLRNRSEADEMLTQALAAAEHDTKNSELTLLHEYEKLAMQLHKRKIIMLVERRAQLLATYLAVTGLVIIGAGFISW